ncbi:hypothetical protein D0C36_11475 [Mucilaginibacter conchicola]|uniref:Gliding motility-associated C-terminal domain-containing protein n=1 Tax=Mucilaginibacter conchicola TaxID=2303333 RepID=A0A372NS05_9SPHI|nr:gliding motility-associated C-terminal domain-containing protein [Mucilaginibacter conchicola]RFZ92060.1 hypothetical protein D0C36_11475 [Mucilaginibacter conchicola]
MQLNFRLLLFLCLLLCSKARAQTPTGSLGDPVVQEDFGSGGSPHYPTTSYLYIGGSCPASGYYALAKTEGGCHDTWHTLTKDHTGNDGYMMIIDASTEPGLFYSQETPPLLCSGTTYEFSAYVKNLVLPAYAGSHSKPDLTFKIETTDGVQIGQSINTGPIYETADPNYWQKVSTIVTIPPGIDAVVVKIFNNANGLVGNDLVLDDIAFRAYGPVVQANFDGATTVTTQQDLCVGSAATYDIKAVPDGATANTRYQWQRNFNDGAGWVDMPGEESVNLHIEFTNAQVGDYQYRLGTAEGDKISSMHCRVYSNTVDVKVSSYPNPPQLHDTPICEGDKLVLTAAGGANYKWTGPNLPAAGAFVNPLVVDNVTFADAGEYHVDVISAAGCITPQTVNVTVTERPVVTASAAETTICEGSGTSLASTAPGAIKFSWLPAAGLSDPNSPAPFASPAETTTYTLTATNANGCDNTAEVTITVNKIPVVSAGSNKAIFEGQSVVLDGSITGDITGFSWSPVTNMENAGSLTPKVTPTDDITYTLNATSATCGPVQKTVFVRVYKKVVVRNSFSPNSDGVNDLWNIEALFTYPESTTAVYDRNGKQVFFSRGYSTPWDGKLNGTNLPVGTYYYVIDLKNGTAPLKGWVLLMR